MIGHSQGEIAAAAVAGALSLEDAARVVALRSLAIAEELAGQGGMASIALDVDTLQPRLPDGVSVAAVNGPRSVVVAGEDAALDALLEELHDEGVWVRRIPVDYPSHSPAVELLEERLLADLGPIAPVSGAIPFYSTLEGGLIDTAELDAAYWYRNLRNPVRFAPTVERLLEDGASLFIEPSPHPVLTGAVNDTIEQAGAAIGTLRRDDGGPERFTFALANAHAHGAPVDWAKVFAGARRISTPTHAFQHQRYWLIGEAGGGHGANRTRHPLLSGAFPVAGSDGWLLSGELSLATHPWLADHAVHGTVLLPGTALLELALTAGDVADVPAIDELTLEAPLILREKQTAHVQVSVGEADERGHRPVTVYSRTDADWQRHAHGVLAPEPAATPATVAWPPPGRGADRSRRPLRPPRGSPASATARPSRASPARTARATTSTPRSRSTTRKPTKPGASPCTPRCSTPPSTRSSTTSSRASRTASCRCPSPGTASASTAAAPSGCA